MKNHIAFMCWMIGLSLGATGSIVGADPAADLTRLNVDTGLPGKHSKVDFVVASNVGNVSVYKCKPFQSGRRYGVDCILKNIGDKETPGLGLRPYDQDDVELDRFAYAGKLSPGKAKKFTLQIPSDTAYVMIED